MEDHFQRARGTSLFLLSPLDWALIATWKSNGIPLEAVLKGIDAAFEKWRARKNRTHQVNSLAYCAQAVAAEAKRQADVETGQPAARTREAAAPFSGDALARFIHANAEALLQSPHPPIQNLGEQLRTIAGDVDTLLADLEELEIRLTAMEEKMLAQLRLAQSDEAMVAVRRELETQLRPHRSKMSGEQLRQLEEQYLSKRLLDAAGLPRLSLFYMTDYGA
ncbi:MAG: hypothetical protein KIT83_02030 [Bryobacterales bacterium]|nr:hypothetical protein [Bryobacterales bacterium]